MNGIRSKSRRGGITGWLAHRFGTKPIEHSVMRRSVPKSRWYYGGGSALGFLFIVLLVTGAILTLSYSPSMSSAHESLARITNVSTLGWFVRALHYWSAGAMVIVLVYHLCRQILLGGYLPPREGTWFVGVILFFLVIANSFTGYTLRWDVHSISAVHVALNMLYRVPFIGEKIVLLVQGGSSISDMTITRLYAFHAILVPLSLVVLIGFHVYLVILHGVTTLAERKDPVATAEEQKELYDRLKRNRETGEPFYPYSVVRSVGFSFVVFLIVLFLSLALGPQEIFPQADLSVDSIPREEWWFNWYSALIAYLPPSLAPVFYFAFPTLLFIVLIALPIVDGKSNRGLRRRPLAVTAVTLAALAFLVLTGLRQGSPWTAWPRTDLPPLPQGITLTRSAMNGRVVFTSKGCFNCHAVGEYGPSFGPNLTALSARLSQEELRRFILEPPAGVAMPSYKGKISEAELSDLVDFVLAVQTLPRKVVETP